LPIAVAMAHISEPPPPAPADTPAHVAQALARALAKQPERRFADIRAFAAAAGGEQPATRPLRRWLRSGRTRMAGGPVAGSEATTTAVPPPLRPRRWSVVAAAVLLAVAVPLAAFLARPDDARERAAVDDVAEAAEQPATVQDTVAPTATPESPQRVRVPKLAGLPEADAKRAARRRGLQVRVTREASQPRSWAWCPASPRTSACGLRSSRRCD
jgi:eukaryotic-like serine/threonine-protein kinase